MNLLSLEQPPLNESLTAFSEMTPAVSEAPGVTTIHPTAIIDPSARLAEGVNIGPYCIIGPNCTVGKNTQLLPHSILERNVILGESCKVGSHAVLGGDPQDLKYKGETSWVRVGNRVKLGEAMTIHRATGENEFTSVADDCFLMSYSHVGHNSTVAERCVFANGVQLAGHVVVEEGVIISGLSAVHQHSHVGRLCMIGGLSALKQDAPPFCMINGNPSAVVGLNLVGLRRNGMGAEDRKALQRAVRLLFVHKAPWDEKLQELAELALHNERVAEFYTFITVKSKRGITRTTTSSAAKEDFLASSLEP
jgi:UDP-N-acetylglucosamine acyltransferase